MEDGAPARRSCEAPAELVREALERFAALATGVQLDTHPVAAARLGRVVAACAAYAAGV